MNSLARIPDLVRGFELKHPIASKAAFYSLITMLSLPILSQIGVLGSYISTSSENIFREVILLHATSLTKEYHNCVDLFDSFRVSNCEKYDMNIYDKLLNCVIITTNDVNKISNKLADFVNAHSQVMNTVDFLPHRMAMIGAVWIVLEIGMRYLSEKRPSSIPTTNKNITKIKQNIKNAKYNKSTSHNWITLKSTIRHIFLLALLANLINYGMNIENYESINTSAITYSHKLNAYKDLVVTTVSNCVNQRIPEILEQLNSITASK